MWTEAEQLLSNDAYRELPNGQFCVAYGDKAFIVKCERNNFVCNCLDFQKFKVCSHVLIVADGKTCLESVVCNYKYCPSAAVNRHNTKQAGEKRVKKPRRGFQNIKKLPIRKYATAVAAEYSYHGDVNLKEQRPFQFCQILHNDERFDVIYINSDNMKNRKILKCISYGNVISRKKRCSPI